MNGSTSKVKNSDAEESDVNVLCLIFTMVQYKESIKLLSTVDDKELEQVFQKDTIIY